MVPGPRNWIQAWYDRSHAVLVNKGCSLSDAPREGTFLVWTMTNSQAYSSLTARTMKYVVEQNSLISSLIPAYVWYISKSQPPNCLFVNHHHYHFTRNTITPTLQYHPNLSITIPIHIHIRNIDNHSKCTYYQQ